MVRRKGISPELRGRAYYDSHNEYLEERRKPKDERKYYRWIFMIHDVTKKRLDWVTEVVFDGAKEIK